MWDQGSIANVANTFLPRLLLHLWSVAAPGANTRPHAAPRDIARTTHQEFVRSIAALNTMHFKPSTLQLVQHGLQLPGKVARCNSTPHLRRSSPRPSSQFIPSVSLPIPTKARLRKWLNVVTNHPRNPLALHRPSRSRRRHHLTEAHGLRAPEIARSSSSILPTRCATSPAIRRRRTLRRRDCPPLRAPLRLPPHLDPSPHSRRRWFRPTRRADAVRRTTSTISNRKASPSLRAAPRLRLFPNPLHSLRNVLPTRQTLPDRHGSTLRPHHRLRQSPFLRTRSNLSRR